MVTVKTLKGFLCGIYKVNFVEYFLKIISVIFVYLIKAKIKKKRIFNIKNLNFCLENPGPGSFNFPPIFVS